MERNFNNEFERFLKENADQYRMYPSSKVWNGGGELTVHSSVESDVCRWALIDGSAIVTTRLSRLDMNAAIAETTKVATTVRRASAGASARVSMVRDIGNLWCVRLLALRRLNEECPARRATDGGT